MLKITCFTSKNANTGAARGATAEAELEKVLKFRCFTRTNVVLTQKLEKVLNLRALLVRKTLAQTLEEQARSSPRLVSTYADVR